MNNISVTPAELSVFVELVAGFRPGEGEVRTLLAVAKMFAAKEGGGLSADDILNAAMTAEAVSTFRAAQRAGLGANSP